LPGRGNKKRGGEGLNNKKGKRDQGKRWKREERKETRRKFGGCVEEARFAESGFFFASSLSLSLFPNHQAIQFTI
jgi:hypothetical protein